MDLLFNGLLTETQLYINDGTVHLTEDTEIPFTDVIWGSIAHADVDGDDDQDVFISGQPEALQGFPSCISMMEWAAFPSRQKIHSKGLPQFCIFRGYRSGWGPGPPGFRKRHLEQLF